jgi:hypothetical protein
MAPLKNPLSNTRIVVTETEVAIQGRKTMGRSVRFPVICHRRSSRFRKDKFSTVKKPFMWSLHACNERALRSVAAVTRQDSCLEAKMSKKAAEHHHSAAEHHEHAAEHHREAAKHHEGGDHEAAAHHAHSAAGHTHHATHHAAEAAKLHVESHGHKSKAATN